MQYAPHADAAPTAPTYAAAKGEAGAEEEVVIENGKYNDALTLMRERRRK